MDAAEGFSAVSLLRSAARASMNNGSPGHTVRSGACVFPISSVLTAISKSSSPKSSWPESFSSIAAVPISAEAATCRSRPVAAEPDGSVGAIIAGSPGNARNRPALGIPALSAANPVMVAPVAASPTTLACNNRLKKEGVAVGPSAAAPVPVITTLLGALVAGESRLASSRLAMA